MVFGFSDDGVQIIRIHQRLGETNMMEGAVAWELDSRAVQGERLVLVERMELELP